MQRLFASLLLVALVAAAAFVFLRPAPQLPGSTSPVPAKSSVSPRVDPNQVAQLEQLEAARRDAENTIWAPELDAQHHESFVIQFWDALRRSPAPLLDLARFPCNSVEIGQINQPQTLEHQIELYKFSGPTRQLPREAWQTLVESLVQAGWHLESSEWRHVQFSPAITQHARSVFTVELHLKQSPTGQRAIVRGRVGIEWGPAPAEGNSSPSPHRVDASRIEIYRRADPPLFTKVIEEIIPPSRDALFVDPLLIRDLDGDGLDDLILAGRNRLYWNQGNGSFKNLKLCPRLDTPLSTAVFGDFDGDGLVDFLGVDNRGLVLFRGDAAGGFSGSPTRQSLPELFNPFVLTIGDVDGDGDLDAWLAQYKVPLRYGQMPTPYHDANDGFPSYLLLNDGNGHFQEGTVVAGLGAKRFRRTYSASFCDLDQDGDLDLVNVSDFAGIDIHLNDGRGHFRDLTGSLLPERHLFGMAHAIADFDGDGRPDLFAVGMNSPAASRLDHLQLPPGGDPMRALMTHGNRTFLNRGDHFEIAPFDARIAHAGWAWGVTAFDFDNDGDLDLYLGNGHRSGPSVRDYEPQFWMHDIQIGRSASDPVHELYFDSKTGRSYAAGESYGGHQRNVFYLNAGSMGWHEVGWLMGVAMGEDSHAVASADLDGDGRPDLLVVTEEYWPVQRHTFSIFRNQTPHRPWIGVRLGTSRDYVPGEPTEVRLKTAARTQHRWILTGDGHRQQSPPVARFGLGDSGNVERVEVLQRGRQIWSQDHPRSSQDLRMGGSSAGP